MDARWTLPELTAECARRIAALPAPTNGQIRAVPDERTIRYYGTLGLLDRPAEMRGRTAYYGPRHAAQVVAIKRLQTAGRSLAEIQALWPDLDDATLSKMSGIALGAAKRASSRPGFWTASPGAQTSSPAPQTSSPAPQTARPAPQTTQLRIDLAPNIVLTVDLPDDASITPADLRAIRAAAGPLLAALNPWRDR